MSVADRLGTGTSFSEARRRSARGRAKAVTQGDVPAYELVRLRLDEVSPTPLNPRRNFGTDDEKTRFGEELRQVQLAACVAVTRAAYLALWPDHEERIGDAAHVLVNGERRFHSAVHVGLDALDFVVRDDLASSREAFINHLLKENLDREDFDVIERARGVQELVTVCAESSERGARSRAAEQLGKDRSWVTNQLVLLQLPDELQAMLSAGSLAERDGRALARHAKDHPELGPAELLDYLKAVKEAEALAKAQERSQLKELREAGTGSLLSADNKNSEPETAGPSTTGLLSADNKPADSRGPSAVSDPEVSLSADNKSPTITAAQDAPVTTEEADEQGDTHGQSAGAPPAGNAVNIPAPAAEVATESAETDQPRRLPYDDPFYIVQHLRMKMAPDDFVKGARFWVSLLREQHPDAYRALLQELNKQDQLLS